MSTRAIQIDLASPVPAYEQIRSALRALLVQRALKPGDRIPTVRRLAADLGVHHNTVAEAYRMLAEEGWLQLKRGLGATVVDRKAPKPAAGSKRDFSKRLNELAAEAISRGLPRSVAARQVQLLAAKLRG